MRGCNEARPSRDLGEQGLQLQRAPAESAKTRGASFSEPAALKVQLVEVCLWGEGAPRSESRGRRRAFQNEFRDLRESPLETCFESREIPDTRVSLRELVLAVLPVSLAVFWIGSFRLIQHH